MKTFVISGYIRAFVVTVVEVDDDVDPEAFDLDELFRESVDYNNDMTELLEATLTLEQQ